MSTQKNAEKNKKQANEHTSISGVTERLGALGHIDTLGPNLSWALAGYHT